MELMSTRMCPPSRMAGLAPRRRFARQGDRLEHHRLTYIQAPAGYGKSSLMQVWYGDMTAQGHLCGWLSMDAGINDVGLFFRYVAACLGRGEKGLGDHDLGNQDLGDQGLGGDGLGDMAHGENDRGDIGLARALDQFLAQAHAPLARHMATAFVNAVSRLGRPVFLFIDDLHLTDSKAITDMVAMILSTAPAQLHLIVASRETAPFSVARLRMLGEIQELSAEDLRFDVADLAQLTHGMGRAPFAPHEAEKLIALTEGWPAGLQLATIAMSQYPDFDSFITQFSGENRTITAFLIDDVLEGLPQPLVDFLLRSAILKTLCADLCNAVIGITDAAAHIASLTARGLFIFSLDDKGDWFRYHHLFSGALQRLLRQRHAGEVGALHQRASRWYGAQAQSEMAFFHAVAGQDWPAAGEILDANCMNLFYQGRLRTLDNLARQLPVEVLHCLPRAQLEQAWSLILEWDFGAAQKIFQRVEDLLAHWQREGRAGEAVLEVKRLLLHRRMMLALFTDEVIALERLVLELLHDFPLEDPYLRGTLENCLMYARRETYRLENVSRMDRTARAFFAQSGSTFVLVWHESIFAPTLHLQGQTEAAMAALHNALTIAAYVAGEGTALQAMPAMLLAEILYEAGDLSGAQALVGAHGPQGESLGFVDNLAALFITKAALHRQSGDMAAARETLSRGEACAQHRGFSRLSVRIWHEQIRLAAAEGDMAFLEQAWRRAGEHAVTARLSPQSSSESGDEYLALGVAQLACQLGHARVGVDVMRAWAHFAGGRGALRSEVRCLVALSCALNLLGEAGEARRKMRQALQKAHGPRFVMSFIDAGPQAYAILRDLFAMEDEATGPVSAFGMILLEMFARKLGDDITRPPVPAQDAALSAPPEALNIREHDILRFAAMGKSNKDIARVMGLTEGTVKWYMQQIFAKMDVRRRSHAVQRARSLGWL